MTETPRFYADKPDRGTAGRPDLLSEMLKAVRLTGSVFLNACFSAPFGVIDPRSYGARTPMARFGHASILHLIVAGSCNFETAGDRRRVTAGEILFLSFPDQYRFWNGDPPPAMVPAGDIMRPGPIEGVWTANYGGGGEEVRMVCGFLESSEFLFAPVFRTLPPLIVERTTDDKVGALVALTVGEIVKLTEAATPGTQAVLGRLMEILFVEVLRHHIARLPAGSRGWFAALNDPVVGRTLQLLHSDPMRRWTVEQLAREVGSSRTVVRERFKALLGRPPIEYVTSWRIQLAAERLRGGQDNVSTVGASVGYESEAAFSRAFKRLTGVTPGHWRDGASALG